MSRFRPMPRIEREVGVGSPIALLTLAVVIGLAACTPPDDRTSETSSDDASTPTTVSFPASDGLEVTADLYAGVGTDAPTVLLFHQSASSRGEFASVAPRLQALGYNALAVDLRWGQRRNGIRNETATRAGTPALMEQVEAGEASPWDRIDASYLDMVAAIEWLDTNGYGGPRVAVGSSFSAMLVYRLGAEARVDAVAAYSPGEYDEDRPELVRSWAASVDVPVLSVAAPDEEDLVAPVAASVESRGSAFVVADAGRHGASILDEGHANMATFVSFVGHVSGGPPAREEVRITTTDGQTVVADRYDAPGDSVVVVAFHQGGGSARGEYGFLVSTLMGWGYDVVTPDVYGGGDRFGPSNRTMLAAPEPEGFSYCDALGQMEAVIAHARAWRPGARLVLWGSSYSGALVLHAAAESDAPVDRVLAFSPADGEPMAGCGAVSAIPGLGVPALVVRPDSEAEIPWVREGLDAFGNAGHRTLVAAPGAHGSSTLNRFRVGADVGDTWVVVRSFLTEN